MHGQCDARPTVIFPTAEHHRLLAGTKLYCVVTEAHGDVNNLPKRYTLSNSRLIHGKSDALTATPPKPSIQYCVHNWQR